MRASFGFSRQIKKVLQSNQGNDAVQSVEKFPARYETYDEKQRADYGAHDEADLHDALGGADAIMS